MSPTNPITPQILPTKLLGSIVCTPSTAAAGQSVRVEVRGPDGKPHDNRETVPISINGVPGSTQYLTWDYAGTHTITAIAHRRGGMEKLSTTIEVAKPAGARPPGLRVRWQPDQPTVARFGVLRGPALRRRGRPSKLTPAQLAQPLVLKTRPTVRPVPTVIRPRPPRDETAGGRRTGRQRHADHHLPMGFRRWREARNRDAKRHSRLRPASRRDALVPDVPCVGDDVHARWQAGRRPPHGDGPQPLRRHETPGDAAAARGGDRSQREIHPRQDPRADPAIAPRSR